MTAANSNGSKRQKCYYRRLDIKRIFTSSVGALIGLGTIAYMTAATGVNFLMPPLGATCFIAFVIPDSAFARPRNIIGGHLISSMIGMVCAYVFGFYWWAYALSVGLAVATMQLLRILHPPAAADPLLVMLAGGVPLDFLLAPVLTGSGTLALLAVLYNRFVTKNRYFRVLLHYVANISEASVSDRLFKSR